jgi:O-antigen ligase
MTAAALLAGLRDRLRPFATQPRFLALAAFLFAGDLKADPRLAWLPVDLTLLTGTLLAGILALRFLRGARLGRPGPAALVGIWYLSFVPGLFQAVPTPYGLQKIGTIFTFTLLSSLAPLLLLEEDADLARAANAMAGFALAITLSGLLGGARGVEGVERLQAFGAGTIALGRAAGFLATYAALLLAGDAPLPGLTFGILALAGITAVFSGSRGPILAAVVALALAAGAGRSRSGRGLVRLAGAGLLFLALAGSALSLAPRGSLRRVEAFLHGEYGSSEAYRVSALRAAWDRVGDHPWGVGWAGFAVQVDPERGLGRQYPHNLLAEVTLESGWLCGAVTLAVLGAALVSAWSASYRPGGRVALAGTAFYLLNALVSGDLNDNRPLFMFLSSALVLPALPGRSRAGLREAP